MNPWCKHTSDSCSVFKEITYCTFDTSVWSSPWMRRKWNGEGGGGGSHQEHSWQEQDKNAVKVNESGGKYDGTLKLQIVKKPLRCSLIPFRSRKQRFGDWWQQQSEVFVTESTSANVVTGKSPQQSSSFSHYKCIKGPREWHSCYSGILVVLQTIFQHIKKKNPLFLTLIKTLFTLNPVVYSHHHSNKWASLESSTGNLDVFILKQEVEDWTLQFGYRCVCVCVEPRQQEANPSHTFSCWLEQRVFQWWRWALLPAPAGTRHQQPL